MKPLTSVWGLKPRGWERKPGQNPAGDPNPSGWDSNSAKTRGLPTEIADLVSGPNEAQVSDVSLQKEFSKRQSDK